MCVSMNLHVVAEVNIKSLLDEDGASVGQDIFSLIFLWNERWWCRCAMEGSSFHKPQITICGFMTSVSSGQYLISLAVNSLIYSVLKHHWNSIFRLLCCMRAGRLILVYLKWKKLLWDCVPVHYVWGSCSGKAEK